MIKTFKHPHQPHLNHKKQKGAALILFFLIILVIISGFIISHLNQTKESVLQNRIFEDQHNARVLAEAKAALLGFAASYAETHLGQPVGYLICPDNDGDGSADPPCKEKSKSVLGCFPYRTLGTPKLTDYLGNELWYAVSGTYKDNPKQGLTSDANGLFQIYDQHGNVKVGNIESDRAIAIVFIPNQPINGQTRGNLDCSKPENYLDTFNGINNAKGTKSGAISGNSGSENLPTILPSTFINSPKTNTFNDQMIWITPEDYIPIYEKMNQWVARRVQHCLNLYIKSNSEYVPWVAELRIDGSDLNYKDTENKLFGHIPLDLSNTKLSNSAMNSFWSTDTWLEETYKKIYNEPIKTSKNCVNDSPPCKCFENDLNDSAGYWGNWWREWKEMVFITLNQQYVPNVLDINDSTKDSNLSLDGMKAKAIITTSGKKLANQNRTTLLDKKDATNYLEASNSNDFAVCLDYALNKILPACCDTPIPKCCNCTVISSNNKWVCTSDPTKEITKCP